MLQNPPLDLCVFHAADLVRFVQKACRRCSSHVSVWTLQCESLRPLQLRGFTLTMTTSLTSVRDTPLAWTAGMFVLRRSLAVSSAGAIGSHGIGPGSRYSTSHRFD